AASACAAASTTPSSTRCGPGWSTCPSGEVVPDAPGAVEHPAHRGDHRARLVVAPAGGGDRERDLLERGRPDGEDPAQGTRALGLPGGVQVEGAHRPGPAHAGAAVEEDGPLGLLDDLEKPDCLLVVRELPVADGEAVPGEAELLVQGVVDAEVVLGAQ